MAHAAGDDADAMGQLPDELERLKGRYDQLVADANKGLLSREDAYRLLSQLTVIDAAGAQWGLNDEGHFTRRRNPAEAPEVTNPGAFAPVAMQMVDRVAPAERVSPLRETAMPTEGESLGGRKTLKSRLTERAERKSTDAATPPFADAQEPQNERIASPFHRHTTSQKQSRFVPALKAAVAQPGPIAVAALILFSLVTSFVTRGGAPKPATTTVATSPTAPTIAPTVGPTQLDVQRVVTALESGPQAALSVVTPGAIDPVAAAVASGEWASLAAAGLSITPEAAVESSGAFQQRWNLTDASGAVVGAYSVTWSQQTGAWLLTALPAKL